MYSKDETKLLINEFWIVFARRYEIVPELRHRKRKWVLYDTGLRGIDLKFDITRAEALVMIEINNKEETRRLEIFEAMLKYKKFLEEGFVKPLTWEFCFIRESGQEVCRIYTSLLNVDFHRQTQWPDIYNFLIDKMLILENNFMEIRDVLEAELF